jgi:hypothetical protein
MLVSAVIMTLAGVMPQSSPHLVTDRSKRYGTRLRPPLMRDGPYEYLHSPVTGAANPTVIVSSGQPGAVVASSTEIFWVGSGDTNEIDEMPLDGGSTVTLATPLDPQIQDMVLASDGTLYWTGDFQVQSLVP